MGRRAEQGRGQRIGTVRARLHDAEILLRQPSQAGEVADGAGRAPAAEIGLHHGDELAHGRQSTGQHGVDLVRPCREQRPTLGGLGGKPVVPPQPVSGVERVEAHGELPWAIQECQRQLHGPIDPSPLRPSRPAGCGSCQSCRRSCTRRGVAQPGRAPALGAGCREFESRRPDQQSTRSAPPAQGLLEAARVYLGVRVNRQLVRQGEAALRLLPRQAGQILPANADIVQLAV